MLATLMIVAGGLDLVTSNSALAAGHIEGNPLMATMQAQLGTWWAGPKVLVHLLLAWLILWMPSTRMITIARIVVGSYALIILNNLTYTGTLTWGIYVPT